MYKKVNTSSPAAFKRKFFSVTIPYGPNRDARYNLCEIRLIGIHPNPGPGHWTESLRVLYLNTRSLKAIVNSESESVNKICKITILQRLVYGGGLDVIALTETWLNDSLFDSEILSGFTTFRQDRCTGSG